MGTSRGWRAIATGVAGVITLVACGGGGGGSAADRQAVEDLLVRHYASPSCDDLTDAGRSAFGHPVEDQACAADIADQAPKDVTVSDIAIDGDEATAVADDFTFTLLKVDGTWLIDG